MYPYSNTNPQRLTPGLAQKNRSAGTKKPKTKTKSRFQSKKKKKGFLPTDKLGLRYLDLFNLKSKVYGAITAEVPLFSNKAEWKTLRCGLPPLNLWSFYTTPSKLIGVRPDKETRLGLIDLDFESPYHPHNDGEAFRGVIKALETIGINRVLIVRSSESEGIHIMAFLPKLINSFDLATGLRVCLLDAGYQVRDGWLEIFPNTKAFNSQYKAHRLPLQSNSFLLDEDLQPWTNDLETFVTLGEENQTHQDMTKLKKACKYRRKKWGKRQMIRKGKTGFEDWKESLEEIMSTGFTAHHQTNNMLFEIGTYGLVMLGKKDEKLADYIASTIITLPGYLKYCRHRHEIYKRAKYTAAYCTRRYYLTYKATIDKVREHRAGVTYNQVFDEDKMDKACSEPNKYRSEKARDTKDRIIAIVRVFEQKKQVFTLIKDFIQTASELGQKMHGVGISKKSFYKHKDLWQHLIKKAENPDSVVENESGFGASNPDSVVENGSNLEASNPSNPVESFQCFQKPSKSNTESDKGDILKNYGEQIKPQKPDTESEFLMLHPNEALATPPQHQARGDEGVWGKKPQTNPNDPLLRSTPSDPTDAETKIPPSKPIKGAVERTAKGKIKSITIPGGVTIKPLSARRSNSKYKEAMLSSEIQEKFKQLHISLDGTLIKHLLSCTEAQIDAVLEAFKQQKCHIHNYPAWITQAIKAQYKPHQPSPGEQSKPTEKPKDTAKTAKPDQYTQVMAGVVKLSPEFMAFWEKALGVPGFLDLDQNLKYAPTDGRGEPRVYISSEIAYLRGKGWVQVSWEEAEKCLNDYLKRIHLNNMTS